MKKTYFSRQVILAVIQFGLVVYLCVMAYLGYSIETDNYIHFGMVFLFIADASYISYKNVQNNRALNHFVFLLLLSGWQFLFSLFENNTLSAFNATILLPINLFQATYFVQLFVFQASAYRYQKQFLIILSIACVSSVICYFVSQQLFAFAYMGQILLSLTGIFFTGIVHRKRIYFVLKSQKRELLISLCFVVLPFVCYIVAFYDKAAYLENMGSYFIVMLCFVSIHNIVFQYHTQQEKFYALTIGKTVFLFLVGSICFLFTAYLFRIGYMVLLVFANIAILLISIFNLLLYWQICRQPKGFDNMADRQHFYAYSLSQFKREEALKKEFSNYLHDDILQDILAVKNLVRKANQPHVQQLLFDTLGALNASVRMQMQNYHPTLLKSLTLKENIQNLLDTLSENYSITIYLECKDTVFLVEPYNVLIYRMIKELVTNALKHSEATDIRVLLIQEESNILLKVIDNGIGFEPCSHQYSMQQGLHSIQEQVCLLDGLMTIQSAPNSGTQITIIIPMKGDESYESFISG